MRIYSICTAKEARGKGVGRALIGECIERARSDGYGRIFLEVRTDNTPALSLYRSFGFSEEKILNRFYLDGCDGVKMKLELDNGNTTKA